MHCVARRVAGVGLAAAGSASHSTFNQSHWMAVGLNAPRRPWMSYHVTHPAWLEKLPATRKDGHRAKCTGQAHPLSPLGLSPRASFLNSRTLATVIASRPDRPRDAPRLCYSESSTPDYSHDVAWCFARVLEPAPLAAAERGTICSWPAKTTRSLFTHAPNRRHLRRLHYLPPPAHTHLPSTTSHPTNSALPQQRVAATPRPFASFELRICIRNLQASTTCSACALLYVAAATMFYSETLLQKNGPLARIWLSSNLERKLSKTHILQSNLADSVEAIIKPSQAPMALRLSGQLLLGVVRIYSRKARYLLDDCNEVLMKVKMVCLRRAPSHGSLHLPCPPY